MEGNVTIKRTCNMELIEAIRARHSVREYADRPIEHEKIATLRIAVEKADAASGLNIQLVTGEPRAFASKLATYGSFSGVSNYLVMAAPRGAAWEEKVGYYGEGIVLLAQTLGLNTCWVGLTYRKVPGAFTLGDGETVHCVISLGYGISQGRQHPLRPMEKFYEAGEEVPEWFKAGLEAALLAPTAVNQQKFRFILHEGDRVEAKALFSMIGYTRLDLGIAKYHFEIGAGKENFTWA